MRSTIHHMGITVRNLEESIEFYSAAFGLQVVDRAVFSGDELAYVVQVPGAELEYAFMAGKNAVLELIEYKNPEGKPYALQNNDVGAAHCCFVVDDLEEVYERLLGMGVTFNAPPQTAPDIAPFNGLKYTYFRDLNGITIELFQPGDGPLSLPQLLAAARAAELRETTA